MKKIIFSLILTVNYISCFAQFDTFLSDTTHIIKKINDSTYYVIDRTEEIKREKNIKSLEKFCNDVYYYCTEAHTNTGWEFFENNDISLCKWKQDKKTKKIKFCIYLSSNKKIDQVYVSWSFNSGKRYAIKDTITFIYNKPILIKQNYYNSCKKYNYEYSILCQTKELVNILNIKKIVIYYKNKKHNPFIINDIIIGDYLYNKNNGHYKENLSTSFSLNYWKF